MAIGRSEDRDTPGNPMVLRHREYVRDPICATHLGQRSIRPHTQAGHMTAIDQTRQNCTTPCGAGAVHTWLLNLLARKPNKLAAVALANKMARILWAMMVSGETYRHPKEA